MDILNSNLETIEPSCLRNGNFSSGVTSQVFVHDTVVGCGKGQDMRNEVTFVLGEPTMIFEAGCEINFFCCPE